jgi:hypothetical protein
MRDLPNKNTLIYALNLQLLIKAKSGSIKSQKHVRCETRGFYDVQIVLQNTLNEADGVLLAKPNSRKQ